MNIVEVLLKELKVKHTKTVIEENYVNAPDCDNMLGIQRVLSRYNIETIGVHFHNKEEAGLTFPCVLHWQDQFVVGVDFDDNKIRFHDGKRFKIEEVSVFNKKWTGDALFVESTQKAHEPSYVKNKLFDYYADFVNYFLFVLVACLGFSTLMQNNIEFSRRANILFDLLGFVICLLLYLKQYQTNNIFADKICSVLEKKGCDSVLESNEAKFLGIVSWTEIGLTYFSSKILFGCLYENSLVLLQIVGWFAMPYGLWSIWSQAFKIKHWCTLCCLIQSIIWCTGLYNIFVTGYIYVKYSDVIIFVVCGMATFVIIQVMSKCHSFKEKYNAVNKNYLGFKMRNNILKTAVSESQEISAQKEDSSIIFGEKSAPITLTVLTNPHCNPCARMHKRLMDLILKNPNINIQYIYCSFSDDLEISSLFCIAVYQQKPYKEALKILEKWYTYGKFRSEEFIKKSGVDIHKPSVLEECAKHKIWRENNGLNVTPIIIYANHKLPENYSVEDFIYLDSEG